MIIHYLISLAHAFTIQQLEEKEIVSSYGFQIMKHYHDEPFGLEETKHFKGQSSLIYLPWEKTQFGSINSNPKGKSISKKFIKKFNYFIPAFYQIQKNFSSSAILLDKQFQDLQLIQQLKLTNPDLKIMPRVAISGMMGDVLIYVDSDQEKQNEFTSMLDEILSNELYDGIYLDSQYFTPNINRKWPFNIKNIVKIVHQQIKKHGKLFFIALDGTDDPTDRIINKKTARVLTKMADKVMLKLYQYPKQVSGRIAPLSPWNWLMQNIQLYEQIMGKEAFKHKAIIMLPLFGKFYSLIGKLSNLYGKELLQKLDEEKSNRMGWDSDDRECSIAQNRYEYIMYPCLNFFKERYKELQFRGLGLALIDAGSGLQIFFHQL